MANANIAGGLSPVHYLSGEPYNSAVNLYSTAAGDATAIFVGDLVTLSGTSQVINGSTYADVDQAATGDICVGVVVAVVPDVSTSLVYRAASTARLVYVCDDPNVVFEVQDVSTGTPLAAADIGLNVNFVVAAGNTYTGRSGMTLNNTTEATTATLDLKIAGFVNRADNEVGASGKWLVRINRHQYANQVAGI